MPCPSITSESHSLIAAPFNAQDMTATADSLVVLVGQDGFDVQTTRGVKTGD